MIGNDAVKAIEDLHRLKGEGMITELEFEEAKRKILFGQRPAAQQFVDTVAPASVDHMGWMILPLKRYAQFEGRSSRKEFWMFLLGVNVVNLAWVILAAAATDEYGDTTGLGKLAFAFMALTLLGVLVPMIAVQVRRFHDQDKSGWFALLNLIPYVGVFIVLVFMLIEGTTGDNQYGPDPKAS